MSLDEIREKHAGGSETANEAFYELCAMVEALEVSYFIYIIFNMILCIIIKLIINLIIKSISFRLYFWKIVRT